MSSTNSKAQARAFRSAVQSFYKTNGRHDLPWRKTKNPYRILVSEIMLQQTQVDRVIPYYRAFLKEFPTMKKLAKAPLGAVLKSWQGLGYNRRAKMLHRAASTITEHGMPKTVTELEMLPGIGPYTARAVAAFAYNEDVVFVETNIRTAILHGFFPTRTNVSDKEILSVLETLMPKGKGREWNLALMDYGAHLKKTGVKLNSASKHYVRQSAFAGSQRQARGAILHALAKGPQTDAKLQKLLGKERVEQIRAAKASLLREGMIEKRGGTFTLPH